ncbi:MAG: alpha-xylosidase [Defluviitaleaceae bacterium]|nr:alpha-xylosidase [Defluviitaleaceae bacterium]
MKFTNGYWMLRKGVSAYPCTDVREVDITPTGVTMFVTPWKMHNRGQTLGGPLLTLNFTAPQEGILHLSMDHYMGAKDPGPAYPYANANCPLTVEDLEKEVIITTGKMVAKIQKEPFAIEYYYNGKFLTGSVPKQLAYMTTDDGAYCRERLQASVDESFYGFGEYFTTFVKNGQVIDIWNEDGGTASEQAYKTVPFYVSNRGYGVFVNHPEKVSFEVCSEVVSKVQFSVKGEHLSYMVIGGDTLEDVLTNYTGLMGRPALPPTWSYGLWLSTSFTTNYDEGTVTGFIDGMAERDIPLSVFHYDCFWMKEYQWCDFEWDKRFFPDPEGMLKRLKEKGLKICVWINPYIGQKSPLFAEGMEKGYLLKNLDGGVWQWDMWQPGLAIVDFTNPEAAKWYQDHLRRLMAMGVDCFKTDFGERIPLDCVWHDGSSPEKMHNYYAYQYNKYVFEVVEEVKGKDEAVLFARTATAGAQQFPVHWGGDCDSNYVSMAESLRGGLSLSLCGFGYWSHDIGGFENTATPDVYKRWVAFGLFSSHSRLHGNISYRVPWQFDEEASHVLRYFSKQKCAMMPYIFANAIKAHKQGIPMMRPMVLSFQNDPVCSYMDRQYMFGDSLLVAPVFNEEGTTKAYLPQQEGRWTNWQTNAVATGGQFVDEKHDYFSLGLWVKPNSIVAMGSNDSVVDYTYSDNPTLHVFELTNAEATIVNPNGEVGLTVKLARSGNKITLEALENHNGFNLLLRNIEATSGELLCEKDGFGTLVKVPAGCKSAAIDVK